MHDWIYWNGGYMLFTAIINRPYQHQIKIYHTNEKEHIAIYPRIVAPNLICNIVRWKGVKDKVIGKIESEIAEPANGICLLRIYSWQLIANHGENFRTAGAAFSLPCPGSRPAASAVVVSEYMMVHSNKSATYWYICSLLLCVCCTSSYCIWIITPSERLQQGRAHCFRQKNCENSPSSFFLYPYVLLTKLGGIWKFSQARDPRDNQPCVVPDRRWVSQLSCHRIREPCKKI